MTDKKFYFIERLEQHPDNCGCYYAWIAIYKDYGGGPVKLAEEYYADLRYWLGQGTACEISPMDRLEVLWDKHGIPVDKKTLRQCITEYFKTIGYEKISKRQFLESH